jgi:DnaK suppressor protein
LICIKLRFAFGGTLTLNPMPGGFMIRSTQDWTVHAEQLLRDRQRRLLEEVQTARSQPLQEHDRGAFRSVEDAGDESVAGMLTDLRAGEAERDTMELRAIDAALARIAAGTYGICEDCAQPIDRARLEAAPAAARCVNCQRKHEHNFRHQSTPSL